MVLDKLALLISGRNILVRSFVRAVELRELEVLFELVG
jgi:hypothetical protein